jgi:hypothetical protein
MQALAMLAAPRETTEAEFVTWEFLEKVERDKLEQARVLSLPKVTE